MATLTKGKTFTNGETVTPQKLHELVDLGTVSGIVNADISASAAIADTKLAQITTANKVAQSAVTNLTTDLAGKAATSHTHDERYYTETEVNTLLAGKQAAGSYAPATGIAPSAITGGAVITTDSRLSDSRTPTAHTHGNITNAGAIGTTSGVPVITGTSGVLQAGAFGTTAGTFCQGNDSRLSDARTPVSHTHDDRYYTETEVNTLLAGKQAAGSYAASSHNHDASNITSGTLANARTTATSNNTVNAIVARDASGNFSAGEISAYTFKARGGPANNPAGPSENGYAFTSPGDNNSGMFSSANGQIEFLINNNEIARLTTSDFLVGTTSQIAVGTDSIDGVLISHFDPRIIVSRNNMPSMECRRRSSNGEIVNFYRDTTKVGNISVTATSTAYNTSSDYRLKTNLEPLTDAIARLLQIPVHRFNWLADPSAPKVDGFLAHEAQAVVPESVTGRKDEVDAEGSPIHQGIDQSKLIPLLVAAVQELAARVAVLESK